MLGGLQIVYIFGIKTVYTYDWYNTGGATAKPQNSKTNSIMTINWTFTSPIAGHTVATYSQELQVIQKLNKCRRNRLSQ